MGGVDRLVCSISPSLASLFMQALESLNGMIQTKIAAKFRGEISFASEAENFEDVASMAMTVLVSGLVARLEPVFTDMSRALPRMKPSQVSRYRQEIFNS